MKKITVSNVGYINGHIFDGVTGVKTPVLPMNIRLLIDNPPPLLTLLINPSSFDLAFTSKVAKQKVRKSYNSHPGYVKEFHHDELINMSVSCTTAMVYNANIGLTTQDLEKTLSYDHYQKLLAIYRNNGKNYDPKQDAIINSVGRVVISYDNLEYRGSFDEFNWTYSGEKPFSFDISWTYTVTEIRDLRLTNNTYQKSEAYQKNPSNIAERSLWGAA